jgi:hypothetical protein
MLGQYPIAVTWNNPNYSVVSTGILSVTQKVLL